MRASFKSFISHNLFYLQNRYIKTVSIIGSGLMGSGIAQVSAQAGYNVTLVDIDQKLLNDAIGKIKVNFQKVAKKKHVDDLNSQEKYVSQCMSNINISNDAAKAASKCDLIIEAIIENIEKKHLLFRSLDATAPTSCIFASNTSSLSISDIASCTKRADRFGGIHFFNPVPLMSLVEIIRTPLTSKSTIDTLTKFASSLGKTPVHCGDTPGFIVNRLLVPYLAEAVRMLERGDATAEDIDMAMKLGAGHPMGPFTLADYVGLDTTKFILDGWHEKFPDNPLFAPIPSLNRLVAEKKLGLKSGEGFFNYRKKA